MPQRLIGLILLLMLVSAAIAADNDPIVPDPYGLGQHLAAINVLKEYSLVVEPGTSDVQVMRPTS